MKDQISRFLKELRRRRVLRTAGLYVVAAWLALQAADILFPGWGVPEEAIRFLFLAVLLGFPVALVFGWIFEITPEGIRRTRSEWSEAELDTAMPLRRVDYVILSVFVVVVGLLVYDATSRVLQTAALEETPGVVEEIIENSVAVLPFANLSPDPEHEYFADGISEEILNRLSSFPELTVIGRTSSFAFKDSGYDIARISGLLGVEYLLQGSIRRDDGQLRIAAQLVDHTGVQRWTQTFDRELGRVFAIQDEIAEAVATSIVPRISPPPAAERLPDLDAYHEFLIGREIMARRIGVWFDQSAERFTRAIELDPEFAEAYASRAIGLGVGSQWNDQDAELDRAQRDIDTALALNPNLAQAFAAQALLDQFRKQPDHAKQEALLRRALALDPNSVDALNWLSGALFAQGRHDEAIEVYHRALRIDPLAPTINANLAMAEARRGRLDEAERRLLRQAEIPQPSVQTFMTLAEIYAVNGRLVESCAMRKRHMLTGASVSGSPQGGHLLASCYATLGLWPDAIAWLERWERAWPELATLRLYRYFLLVGYFNPGERLAGMLGVLEAEGVEPGALDTDLRANFREAQALAGDFEGAISAFENWIDPNVAIQGGIGMEVKARHALAWAWLQTGEEDRATAMLELMDAHFREQQAEGRLHLSADIFDYARNALLLGDGERALNLLEQAEQAGWRGYYAIQRDPRWDPVREHPRFVEIMTRVKADIDRQRARMEQIDAEDDFAARLDAAIAARRAEEPER